MAFRDGAFDPAAASRFGQHIGIAEDALEGIEKIPAMIEALPDGTGLTQEVMDIWSRRWAAGWQAVWEQLRDARAIVVQHGRDISVFDAATSAAGNTYDIDVATGKARQVPGAVQVSWQNTSTKPARDAIAALRAAMPEVVVVKHAPLEVDLEPAGNKALLIAGGVGVLGLIVYLIYAAA